MVSKALYRTMLVALLAAASFAMSISSASGSTGLSVTNGVTSMSASGTLTLSSAIIMTCDVTLAFEMNRSIAKSPLAAVATLLPTGSGSSWANCATGAVGTWLAGATISYVSFLGTLPDITQLSSRALNVGFSLSRIPILGTCLWTGTFDLDVNRNAATGRIDSIGIGASRSLSSPCGATSLAGTLAVQETKPILGLV